MYIVGAVVRGRLSCSSAEPQESLDGDLAFRVFQLIQVMDVGFHATRYGAESRQRLDLAVLNFFGNFRKVYVGEQAMHSSKVYVQLSERMGLHDHLMVMNLTVTKITKNLKSFAQCHKVVEASLNLLQDLAVGFMSGKLLLRLDAVNQTLANHTPDHFPFLNQYANTRNRTDILRHARSAAVHGRLDREVRGVHGALRPAVRAAGVRRTPRVSDRTR